MTQEILQNRIQPDGRAIIKEKIISDNGKEYFFDYMINPDDLDGQKQNHLQYVIDVESEVPSEEEE
jgi:hypothetical protein